MYPRHAWLPAIFFASTLLLAQVPAISNCPIFPANNVWNARVDTLPVDPHSSDYINNISASGGLRFDITIPINVVPGTTPLVPININYPDESDPGPYPFPANAQVEMGSDLHVILLDKDHCMLYETFNSALQPNGSWTVDTSAKWNMLSNALRPSGWTSSDAAGLPILPGLLRYDEVAAGQVNHALRFTAPHTQRLFIWPARHYASQSTSTSLPPMGQRFRLKASFDISSYPPHIQTILRAMKQYGLMLADNGLPWEMQFAVDPRWDTSELDILRTIPGSNLEAADESSLMVDPNSGQVPAFSSTLFSQIAIFRFVNGSGVWVVDTNGDNVFDTGDQSHLFGMPGDQPVAGDWDGTGVVRVGVFRNGLWLLDLNNNGQWDGVAGGDGLFAFGAPGDLPIVGDWNGDGRTKLGVFRCPATGVCTWVLDYAGKFAYDATAKAYFYGGPGDLPVVNNWSGTSNVDQIGVYRPMPNGLGLWIVDSNGSGAWEASDAMYQFGIATDLPVVGNWNNGSRKRIGVFRGGMWILDTNGSNAYESGDAVGFFGVPGDQPLVGKWR